MWSGINPSVNPYAPGGASYEALRSGQVPYGTVSQNPNPGPLWTGTRWDLDNPYAAGGAKFGYQPGLAPNWTTQQLGHSAQAQKQAEQARQAKQNQPTNPLADILGNLIDRLGGSGGSGGGGIPGGGMGTVTSGIDVGPVWSDSQVQAGANALKAAGAAPAPSGAFANVSGPAAAALQRQYGDMMRGEMSSAATDFTRGAAYANAQQQLASEKARAQSNLSSAELLARLQAQQYQNQLNNEMRSQSLVTGLLGSLFA